MAALLPCKSVTTDKDGKEEITTTPGMPEAVPALATKAGISTTKTKITALYTSIDVGPGRRSRRWRGFEDRSGAAGNDRRPLVCRAFVAVNILTRP